MLHAASPFTDEIILSDYGGGNPRRVPVVDVAVSWEMNNLGNFSARARLIDLQQHQAWGELKGMWLQWQHRTGGRWGGVVMARPIDEGVAEIVAEGWASLLRNRLLAFWDHQAAGSAAGIARRGVMSAEADEPSFITFGIIDEFGDPVSFRLGGQDILEDFLGELVDEGDMEWYVDADRQLHCGYLLGIDRSATVRLTEGYEIVSAQFSDDAYAAPPDPDFLVALPQDMARHQYVTPRASGTLLMADGITPLSGGGGGGGGAWQDPQVEAQKGHHKRKKRKHRRGSQTPTPQDPPIDSPPPSPPPGPPPPPPITQPLPPVKPAFIEHLQAVSYPAQLTICDRNNAFYHTQLGDSVRIVVESASAVGKFRVMSRGMDSTQDVMELAGEFTPDPVLP